jgi:hypothetical protein
LRSYGSGCSVAWLARLLGVQEVGSSNLPTPTILLLRFQPPVLNGLIPFATAPIPKYQSQSVFPAAAHSLDTLALILCPETGDSPYFLISFGRFLVGKPYAYNLSMTVSTRHFKRSEFFRSINIVWPTNHLRTARTDFWGAVTLVCVIGLFAKVVQSLLTN